MLEETRIKAEQLLAQSYDFYHAEKYDIALSLLSKGQALLNKDSHELYEQHLYFEFLNNKFIVMCADIVMHECADKESRRKAAEEATKYGAYLPDVDDVLTQGPNDTSLALMHAYLGNFPKAIQYANKVDIDSPELRASDNALTLFMTLFRVYAQIKSGYDIDRFKNIAFFIIDIFESVRLVKGHSRNPLNFVQPRSSQLSKANAQYDLIFYVDDLLDIYLKLASLEIKLSSPLSCLSWCGKAWDLAQEAGFDSCNTDTVLSLCIFASSCARSQPVEYLSEWCVNILGCLKAMVAQGMMSLKMASSYVSAQNVVFSDNPSNDFLVINPLFFLDTIENSDYQDKAYELPYEYWLCGFWLSRGNSWSTPKGRKAYRLLSKALRALTLQNAKNTVYAHALGLIADAHLAKGEVDLAVEEFTEAERIMSKLHGKDHVLSKQYQAGLEKALAQM
ncbi:MAG: hypothetical protein LBT59_29455 [Clostridiales bacterium]|jgi:tetratricopeptide (TPR) repeat protein|nr:hypothetical protein [Clostridiales bacterium]